MKNRHHKFPKCFKYCVKAFFNLNGKSNIVEIREQDHHAWNQLTNLNQMTLGEMAERFSQFIPDSHKFICVRRDSCNPTG